MLDEEVVFECIPPLRQARIRKAVARLGKSIAHMNADAVLREYFKTDTRRSADFRRSYLYCYIDAEFMSDDNAFVRQDKGGLVLELGGTHAVHFKDVSRTSSPYVPIWVNPAAKPDVNDWSVEFFEQLSLSPEFGESELIRIGPPLDSLIPMEAKYKVDEIDGSIRELYILDYATGLELLIDLDMPITPMEAKEGTQELRTKISKKA